MNVSIRGAWGRCVYDVAMINLKYKLNSYIIYHVKVLIKIVTMRISISI